MRITRSTILALMIAVGAASLVACSSGQRTSADEYDDIEFDIRASDTRIAQDEIVTVRADTENTYGRDAKVKWTSTGGDIDTEDDGRIARITFEKPGMYTMTGNLELEGEVVLADSVDIRVTPVP